MHFDTLKEFLSVEDVGGELILFKDLEIDRPVLLVAADLGFGIAVIDQELLCGIPRRIGSSLESEQPILSHLLPARASLSPLDALHADIAMLRVQVVIVPEHSGFEPQSDAAPRRLRRALENLRWTA